MGKRRIAVLAALVAAVVLVAGTMARRDDRVSDGWDQQDGSLRTQAEIGDHDHADQSSCAGHEVPGNIPRSDHGGDDHAARQGHEGHDHADESALVRLSQRELEECGVTLGVAGPGRLGMRIVLPGEVKANGDRLVHVIPAVPGIVKEVRKTLGDCVLAGEILAVLESRELADAKADFLAARERLALAESNYSREKSLWESQITSEQEYLDARREFTEAKIELRSSEQKLRAFGLSERHVAGLTGDGDQVLTSYEVRAPFAGTVVGRHITMGEKVSDDAEVFVIADLSTVWVDLSVSQKDFPYVRNGAAVVISAGYGVPDVTDKIDYVSPVIGEATRTATARVVLPNEDGHWRPGLFVSATLSASEAELPVVIPATAAQQMDGEWVVFVEGDGGFETVPIMTGRNDGEHIEVMAGLAAGQRYVAEGAFECKAKILTSNMDPHAGHGH